MKNRWRENPYLTLFVVNFTVNLGFGIADPFFSLFAVNIGASGFSLALIFSGYALTKALFTPMIGWWSDHQGRRAFITAGLCLYFLISLCYLLTPGLPFVIFLRLLQGLAAALVRPISLAFVGDIAPSRLEGTALGTFDISFYGPLAIGPVIGGIVKDTAGFSGIFFCTLALCCIGLIFSIWLDMGSGEEEKGPEREKITFPTFQNGKTLIGLAVFIFARSFGIVIFAMMLPIFMTNHLMINGARVGVVMASGAVVTVLLLRPMGRLSDRRQRRSLVVVGGFMAGFLTFCFPLATGFHHILLFSIGIGVFSVLSLPASAAMLIEEGHFHGMGLSIGIFNGALNLGFIIAPLMCGIITDLFGISTAFHVAGLLGMVGVGFFYHFASAKVPTGCPDTASLVLNVPSKP
jgi:MFS family permease